MDWLPGGSRAEDWSNQQSTLLLAGRVVSYRAPWLGTMDRSRPWDLVLSTSSGMWTRRSMRVRAILPHGTGRDATDLITLALKRHAGQRQAPLRPASPDDLAPALAKARRLPVPPFVHAFQALEIDQARRAVLAHGYGPAASGARAGRATLAVQGNLTYKKGRDCTGSIGGGGGGGRHRTGTTPHDIRRSPEPGLPSERTPHGFPGEREGIGGGAQRGAPRETSALREKDGGGQPTRFTRGNASRVYSPDNPRRGGLG